MNGDQQALVRALLDLACHEHEVESIDLIETHISYVLLAGAFAYKIKKAVDLGFLDFGTLEKRHFCCQEELRLNRRLAPRLYLDVVPITGTPQAPRINGSGAAIEYAVKMARFPQQALLDQMLAAGVLSAAHIDAVAGEVASFHLDIAAMPVPDGFGTADAIWQPMAENFVQIGSVAGERPECAPLAALQAWSEAEFSRCRADFTARRAEGRVRECHGDLHLGNMAWLDGRAVLFDCIEFNPNLRWIDVMSDAAFVAMDLHDRGRPDLAWRFLNTYLERTGDFGGLRVLPYYLVYRALVRAKVACIDARQAGCSGEGADRAWRRAGNYLVLAGRFCRPVRPWLLITHGYSGSGKTTATQFLLEQGGAIRLRSDVERKRLFGLAPEARSRSGLNQGLYAPEAHVLTYRRLADMARAALVAGFPVIVDAAFLKRAERDTFRTLAEESGAAFLILELLATPEVLRERVARRAQLARDASEATLDVLELQLRNSEALAADERAISVMLESGSGLGTAVHALATRLMDNPDEICQDCAF